MLSFPTRCSARSIRFPAYSTGDSSPVSLPTLSAAIRDFSFVSSMAERTSSLGSREAGLRIFGFLSHTFSLMSFKHTPPCIALPFPTLFLLSLLLFFQPFQFPYRFLHQRIIGIIENTGQRFPSPLTRY